MGCFQLKMIQCAGGTDSAQELCAAHFLLQLFKNISLLWLYDAAACC